MAQPLPDHASVVVIGGGIMGASTLYHLGQMGVTDAVLVERNRLTSGTTWHSAAQVRALRHSQNLTRMIQYSVDLYARLEAETGQSVGWIQKGSLSIATQADRLTHIRRQEALAQAYGIPAQSVSREEALERWPLMNAEDVLGSVWSPEDGRVSPSDVVAALVKAAKTQGAKIFEQTGVTGILTDRGRITGVETAKGVIRCQAVALCAGLWSREIGAMAGAEVPLWPCEHFYLLTKPVPGIAGNMPTLSDHDAHLYIRDDSGGLLVGCFEPMGKAIAPGVLDETFEFGLLAEDWDHFEPMMEAALHRLPALETAEVKMLLNGPESFTPDGTFMLGETAETRGLFLGCGMNSVGIAAGGGAGMNLAHAIVHGRTAYDLSEADAQRFAPVFNGLDHLMARAPEVLGRHYEIAYPGRDHDSARGLKQLPLLAEYQATGAHFGQTYGWERPLYFGADQAPRLSFGRPEWFENVAREVRAAHEAAAIFDPSPFGKIEVEGPEAEAFMLKVCAGRMSRAPGSVIYSAVLTPDGTYLSDVTVQRLTPSLYRIFTGTNAIKRDIAWLSRWATDFDIKLTDVTERYAVLALMGPEAARIAAACGADGLSSLGYFQTRAARIAGLSVQAARMSYVGEAGWEITCLWEDVRRLYQALTAHGAQPAGLYAQTSMRIEKGFCAMGHELDRDITPIEAGLGFAVRKGGDFIGAEAVAERRKVGATPAIYGLVFDDPEAVALGHEPVLLEDRIIGQTSSAAFGYRVGRPVALAHLKEPVAPGTKLSVDIARTRFEVTASLGALYDPEGKRMKQEMEVPA
ncbi:MAG: FAD-dependent oxidoreductase [Pseudomonadota bacterium]